MPSGGRQLPQVPERLFINYSEVATAEDASEPIAADHQAWPLRTDVGENSSDFSSSVVRLKASILDWRGSVSERA